MPQIKLKYNFFFEIAWLQLLKVLVIVNIEIQ
jgi:hypothetical protein